MSETKLHRAGRLTIRKLMLIIDGSTITWFDDGQYCGFCHEYDNRGPCDDCPIHTAGGRDCIETDWYNTILDKEHNDKDITSDCQALICWIHDLTGADIPERLE